MVQGLPIVFFGACVVCQKEGSRKWPFHAETPRNLTPDLQLAFSILWEVDDSKLQFGTSYSELLDAIWGMSPETTAKQV